MSLDPGWITERLVEALVGALDEVVLLFDAELRCRGAGARLDALFGVDAAAARGAPRAELLRRLSASADDPAAFEAAVAAAGGAPQLLTLARPAPRQVVWTTVDVPALGGRAGVVDIVRDVTGERASQHRLEALAQALSAASLVDEATGLMSRRRFEQDLDREHRRAQRAWDSYAIARVDVDGMAALNASLGRAAGDDLLRRLGEELRASRREYDLVARWGADEYAVCLPGVDGKAAEVVLRRALLAMRRVGEEAAGRSVTLSAGVSVWIPPSGDGPADMIRRAGEALDVARGKGPSAIVVDAGAGRWKDDMEG